MSQKTPLQKKAGLKQGDVILKLNGQQVESIGGLRNTVALTKPGTKVVLTIRRNKETLELPIEVGNFPENAPEIKTEEATNQLGLSVQELTPEISQSLGYQNEKGVVVTKVDPSSISSLAGIRKGSLIVSINKQQISSVDEFKSALSKAEKGKPVLLLIKEGQMMRFVSLKGQ